MSPVDSSIPESIVRENVARLKDLMKQDDFAAVILFHASNMLAFTGTPHAASDRLTCGVVTREGEVHVVCPAFERPGVCGAESIATIHTWQEHEDAYQCFADALRRAGVRSGKLGVDGRTWLNAWYAFEEVFGDLQLLSAERLIREVRLIKSPAVQDLLRATHRKGEQFFFILRDMIRPGVSEIELHRELQARFREQGIEINPMIQSGPNGAIPHNPTGQRVLQAGDNVVVDSVITVDGLNNDLTRTFAVGDPSPRAKQAYQAVRRAQAAAIEAARPGIQCRELDHLARRIISAAGYGEYFTHRLGHGLGIECHEPPYLNGRNTETLRPGMCMTVEPGTYVPGEFGVRIEDDILITEDGCEVIRGELPTDVTDAFDR
ncbi:MAG: M24 family metallopeptidase [Phycisphaerae bacterium]